MKFFRNKKYASLQDLVKACQGLDPKAQTIFYDRYKSGLIGICLRYARTNVEAEDIFQESFIKVFKNLEDVKNVEAIDGWIKSIVIRTAINYYHRTTKHDLRNDFIDINGIDIDSGDFEKIFDQMSIEELREIINQLPEGYKMVINLHLIDGFSHVEIAELLSISDGTCRSQFLRGRNLLIKKLEEHGITKYENPR